MDTISSTEFRKRFASLKAAVKVTVHGHVIGEWMPVASTRYMTVTEAREAVRASAEEVVRDLGPVRVEVIGAARTDGPMPRGFGAPRPAPKPGKR